MKPQRRSPVPDVVSRNTGHSKLHINGCPAGCRAAISPWTLRFISGHGFRCVYTCVAMLLGWRLPRTLLRRVAAFLLGVLTAFDDVGETDRTPCAGFDVVEFWVPFAVGRASQGYVRPGCVTRYAKRPQLLKDFQNVTLLGAAISPLPMCFQCMDQQARRAPHSTTASRVAPCHRRLIDDEGSPPNPFSLDMIGMVDGHGGEER